MSTQTTWNDKAQCHVAGTLRSRADIPAGGAARYLSFCLVLAVLAAPLYWLLPAFVEAAGMAWSVDYALQAAVPLGALAVLVRALLRKHLRG